MQDQVPDSSHAMQALRAWREEAVCRPPVLNERRLRFRGVGVHSNRRVDVSD